MPWLFTGTISVRSRFTGPTPVARFSIAVVISGKLSACRLREPEKRTRSRNEKQADVRESPRFGRARPKPALEILVSVCADENQARTAAGLSRSLLCFRKTLRLEHCRITACVDVYSCKIRPETPLSFARRVEARPGCARHNRRRPCRARKFVARTHRASRRSELLTFAHTPRPCPPSPPT